MAWHEDSADEEWVEDESGDTEDDLLECPSCGREVHEDTQQCPHCQEWIVPRYPTGAAKRWIWAAAAILLILSLSGLLMF